MPCGTPVCHHQFSEAPPCARREPPQTPEVQKQSITQVYANALYYFISEETFRAHRGKNAFWFDTPSQTKKW